MISVIIPTLNAEARLAEALTALVPAAVDGLIREVIVVDGGSSDRTAAIVDQAGAQLVSKSGGRGHQLLVGARKARFPWLLFLHADTALEAGWERDAMAFIEAVDGGKRPLAAAAFRFKLEEMGVGPRVLEQMVRLRCALLKMPYGDQGLLLPKLLYASVGGYNPLPLMEDVDLARRLRRRRIVMLRTCAVTTAPHHNREGYLRRSVRNLACLIMYFAGVSTSRLERFYAGRYRSAASKAREKGRMS